MQTPPPDTAILQARRIHAPPPAVHREITVRELVRAPDTNISGVMTSWIQAMDFVPEVDDQQTPCVDSILLPATVLYPVYINDELQTQTPVGLPETNITDVCLPDTSNKGSLSPSKGFRPINIQPVVLCAVQEYTQEYFLG